MTVPKERSKKSKTYHRFLDETGDTTFFGRGDRLLVGTNGVSLSFGMGLTKIKAPLDVVRNKVRELEKEVENDPLLSRISSVQKRIRKGGFFFHASEDTPDVRLAFLRYLHDLDCDNEIVIARKLPAVFVSRHEKRQDSFYADLLSHLIKSRMKRTGKLVLNIAERGSSTREKTLAQSLEIARKRAAKKWDGQDLKAKIVFNIQTPRTEPILAVADYFAWSVQRVFEKGETKYYDYFKDKIRLVVDLYDFGRYNNSQNYYDPKRNPLTSANKISPPVT